MQKPANVVELRRPEAIAKAEKSEEKAGAKVIPFNRKGKGAPEKSAGPVQLDMELVERAAGGDADAMARLESLGMSEKGLKAVKSALSKSRSANAEADRAEGWRAEKAKREARQALNNALALLRAYVPAEAQAESQALPIAVGQQQDVGGK